MMRDMETVEKREAAETAALENMVQQVEANLTSTTVRDWSLIKGRRGGYKMGKLRFRNFLPLPPSRQCETFCDSILKSGNFFRPPSI